MKQWWKAAGIRAIKTVAQTAIAMIPVGVSVTEVGWYAVAGIPEVDDGVSPLGGSDD